MEWKTKFYESCLDFNVSPEIVSDTERIPELLDKYLLPKLNDYEISGIKSLTQLGKVLLLIDYKSKSRMFCITIAATKYPNLSMILYKISQQDSWDEDIIISKAMLGKRQSNADRPAYPEFFLENYGSTIEDEIKNFCGWFLREMSDSLKEYINGKDWTNQFAFERDNY